MSKAVAADRQLTETMWLRVPDCRTSNREGPTTESAERVMWHGQGMSSGWP